MVFQVMMVRGKKEYRYTSAFVYRSGNDVTGSGFGGGGGKLL
jgi:hypothetical protein